MSPRARLIQSHQPSTQASQETAAANLARFLPSKPAGASQQRLAGPAAQAPHHAAVQGGQGHKAGQHRQPGPAPGADEPVSVRTRKQLRKR